MAASVVDSDESPPVPATAFIHSFTQTRENGNRCGKSDPNRPAASADGPRTLLAAAFHSAYAPSKNSTVQSSMQLTIFIRTFSLMSAPKGPKEALTLLLAVAAVQVDG